MLPSGEILSSLCKILQWSKKFINTVCHYSSMYMSKELGISGKCHYNSLQAGGSELCACNLRLQCFLTVQATPAQFPYTQACTENFANYTIQKFYGKKFLQTLQTKQG